MIPAREVNHELKRCLEQVPIGTTFDELIAVYTIVLIEGHGGNRSRAGRECGRSVRTMRNLVRNVEALGYPIEAGKNGKRMEGYRSGKANNKYHRKNHNSL